MQLLQPMKSMFESPCPCQQQGQCPERIMHTLHDYRHNCHNSGFHCHACTHLFASDILLDSSLNFEAGATQGT